MPDWEHLDRDGVWEYVQEKIVEHKLSDYESGYLKEQIEERLGYRFLGRPMDDKARNKAVSNANAEVLNTKSIGSGLTERVIWKDGQDKFRYDLGPTENRKRRNRLVKHAFHMLTTNIRRDLEDVLWASGYLQIGLFNWLVPENHDERPFEGVWWYVNEIEKLLDKARDRIHRDDAQKATYTSFKAGELYKELMLKVSHNEFFKQQQIIWMRQQEAAASRRQQSDEERRERVRYYMKLGDKPTHAADYAAQDFGVSRTTIRNAFPNSLLPKSLKDF